MNWETLIQYFTKIEDKIYLDKNCEFSNFLEEKIKDKLYKKTNFISTSDMKNYDSLENYLLDCNNSQKNIINMFVSFINQYHDTV